jgi:hypothetical protein
MARAAPARVGKSCDEMQTGKPGAAMERTQVPRRPWGKSRCGNGFCDSSAPGTPQVARSYVTPGANAMKVYLLFFLMSAIAASAHLSVLHQRHRH